MALYWIGLVFLALVVNASGIVMKLRANEILQENERLSWWNHDARAVSRKYRELFPDSYLPDVERYSFWLFLVMLAIGVIASLWKSD